MDTVSAPVFAQVVGYLGLYDMEAVARTCRALYQSVLRDTGYHRRVHAFVLLLEKQIHFLEGRDLVSHDVIDVVRRKHFQLRRYYDDMAPAGHLFLLFPQA